MPQGERGAHHHHAYVAQQGATSSPQAREGREPMCVGCFQSLSRVPLHCSTAHTSSTAKLSIPFSGSTGASLAVRNTWRWLEPFNPFLGFHPADIYPCTTRIIFQSLSRVPLCWTIRRRDGTGSALSIPFSGSTRYKKSPGEALAEEVFQSLSRVPQTRIHAPEPFKFPIFQSLSRVPQVAPF